MRYDKYGLPIKNYFNEYPEENNMYIYTLKVNHGNIEMIITHYKYKDVDCGSLGTQRCYVSETRPTHAIGIDQYNFDFAHDATIPYKNSIRLHGDLNVERALNIFLKDKVKAVQEKESKNPLTIRDLDYLYIEWIENELSKFKG